MAKKTATVLIVALLLALPFAMAQDANQQQETTGQQDDNSAQEIQPEDLTQVCSDRRRAVLEGDSLTFCKIDLTVDALNSDSITINGESISLGSSLKFDGVEASYEEFSEGQGTVILKSDFGKKLSSTLEANRFKIFYENENGEKVLAGTADANTDEIAKITYGTNIAGIKIRSSTPRRMSFGIDMQDKESAILEKLHFSWVLERTEVRALDTADSSVNPAEAQLFSSVEVSEDGSTTNFNLGETPLTIEYDDTSLESPAVRIESTEPFTVIPAQAQTRKLWITTKLAEATAGELSCIYDVQQGSLDDFTRRSSVQGQYPADESFFDTFIDYCKDSSTLINYGCVGLKGAQWEQTSRVSFLEVTCACNNGACTQGPYCTDTDRNAPDPYSRKGGVAVYTPRQGGLPIITGDAIGGLPNPDVDTPSIPDIQQPGETRTQGTATEETSTEPSFDLSLYDSGMKRFEASSTFMDQCDAEGNLVEYSCDLNEPAGYKAETVACANGCHDGACLGEGQEVPAGGEGTEAPVGGSEPSCGDGTCDSDETEESCPADCTTEEDLSELRDELESLENTATRLRNAYENQDDLEEGVQGKFSVIRTFGSVASTAVSPITRISKWVSSLF